ncbi:NAD-dependent epimerase/dehydratase family protein [Patescibacteria group bacterium]|nr:NAD-dependent epimerase/dehydratase family protein [Patescibacteria group bacterium]MBU2036098.1 NAD-dependent epimerase/dehydratase family protein [Patescibacteria group bacterium]
MDTKILVTGAFGQIGSELTPELQKKYGKENVIALGHKNIPEGFDGIVETAEINDFETLKALIEKYQIKTIFHLVSILSANGEKNPDLTWKVNMGGLKNILDLARDYHLQVFWPSTIAAFGPSTPKEAPQHTIMQPTTMYGVTKVSGELLCNYYFLKYGVDVRSVRYPGIISWKTPPEGGTSDYSVAIFYDGIKSEKYECFVGPETTIPLMYIPDCIKGTIDIMEAPIDKIKIRTSYNLGALSFSAKELSDEINKHIKVEVTYKPDARQAIADSWPKSFNDSDARADWGWSHSYTLDKMVSDMIENLKIKFSQEKNG